MTNRLMVLRIAALAAVLASCESSPVDPTETTLRAGEVVPLLRAVVTQFRALSGTNSGPFPTSARTSTRDPAIAGPQPSQSSGPRDSITVVLTNEASGPCKRDQGFARLVSRVTSRLDAETMSGIVDGNLMLSLTSCVVTTTDGDSFALTGDPDLRLSGKFELAGGVPVGTAVESRLEGAFTWQHDSGTGRCTVDLIISQAIATGIVRARGSFCNASVDQAL